jgi:4-amino-4-deoxy-L-arabinose transferase-like glycosyltransferase
MTRRRVIASWFALIFVLALAARLAATFALKRWDDPTPGAYRQLALNLLEHGAYSFREFGYFGPSSVQTPLYPAMLAGLFALFGPENPAAYFAALSLNAVFGGLCALTVAQAVRRSGAGDATGVAAGIVTAVVPAQVLAAQFVQPMVLTALLTVSAILLWQRARTATGLWTWLGFSVAAAAAAMLQPTLLPALAVALPATLFARCWPLDIRIRNAAVLGCCVAVLWVPWLARNAAVHGRPVITSRYWQDRYATSNPYATGSDRLPLTPQRRAAAGALRSPLSEDSGAVDVVPIPLMQIDELSPRQRAELQGKSEAQREQLFADFCRHISGGKAIWLTQFPIRLAKAWMIDWDHPMSRHALAMVPRWTIGAISLVGLLWFAARRLPSVGPMVAVLAGSALGQALSIASARQVIAMEPVQIALAFTVVAVAFGRSAAPRVGGAQA